MPAREAVRLVARVAKAVEALHAQGRMHGRIDPNAFVLTGRRLASARMRRLAMLTTEPAFHSPQRGADGAPSRDDDAYAIALLLFYLLTGQGPEARGASGKFPPLAVFDAGDDALDSLLSSALSPALGAEFRDLSVLRRELDLWLEEEGTSGEEPLLWEDEVAGAAVEHGIDLSSIPPPPEPETPLITVENYDPDVELQDRETLPGESTKKSAPRSAPKLIPPKVLRDKAGRSASRPPPSFEHTSSDGAARTEGEARGPGRSRRTAVLIVGAAAAVTTALWLATTRDDSGAGQSSPSAEPPRADANASSSSRSGGSSSAPASPAKSENPSAPSAGVAAPPRSSNAGASSKASAASSSIPSADESSSARTPAPPPTSPLDCVLSTLAPDTFATRPKDLDFVCTENDVVKGAGRLRTRIVLAGDGRAVTDGMKEWAMLGFYELAAFAAMHDLCCVGPKPSRAPRSPEICKKTVQAAVREIGPALLASDGALDDAIAEFDKATKCVSLANQADVFGGHPRPSGGEGTVLRRILGRLKAAKSP